MEEKAEMVDTKSENKTSFSELQVLEEQNVEMLKQTVEVEKGINVS